MASLLQALSPMSDSNYGWGQALAAGAVGAVTLTTVHQLARRFTEDAPRMDVVGGRAIERGVLAAGAEPPAGESLKRWALAGDLLSNTAYYSLIAYGRDPHVWRRAAALGLAAGAGALVLPRRMGLGDPPHSDSLANQVMTVGWYLIGGLAAAAASRSRAFTGFANRTRERHSGSKAHENRPHVATVARERAAVDL